MTRRGFNVPKACDPCRKTKNRCSGDEPCQRCADRDIAAQCVYRGRPRIRQSARRARITADHEAVPRVTPGTPDELHDPASVAAAGENHPGDSPRSYLNSSVMAGHGNESDFKTNPRLFYGPSSPFAFLQQIHRILLSRTAPQDQQARGHARESIQEGGPLLDLFKQRPFFFGTPSRVSISSLGRAELGLELSQHLRRDEAFTYLSHYKLTNYHLLPCFTYSELDTLINSLYPPVDNYSKPSQLTALALAILANGALNTTDTDRAELLFTLAKYAAMPFDDIVSLTMIQFSILLAQYQNNMGRSNSSYLHIGVSCRKTRAMGLNADTGDTICVEGTQQRLITLWVVYYHEIMQAIFLGREGSLKKADIKAPFPNQQPFLVGLCRLAQIAEDSAVGVYGWRYNSLWELYTVADKTRRQLRQCADELGLDSATLTNSPATSSPFQSLHLHHTYYHISILTFRPFLIAEFAAHSGDKGSGSAEPLWLRQACRCATDAAQDAIIFTRTMFDQDEECKTIRLSPFFIETSCLVLLYDSLRHSSKLLHYKEYIELALQCIEKIIQDEPVTHSKVSLIEMLRIVDDVLERQANPANLVEPGVPVLNNVGQNQETADVGISREMIYHSVVPPAAGGQRLDGSMDLAYDGIQNFDVDILTTDLFTLFTANSMIPSAPIP